ncbi:M48 family metalloprotease [Candidatus Kuenenbacteria bacterium]|nr:M48 family metalloprotease [Candidatus Kuenenbacteria bacterium]
MYQQIDSNKRKTLILMTLFLAFVIFLGWVIGKIYPDYGYGPLVMAVVISLVMTLVSYFAGDKISLATAGAKGPITVSDNPYVYRLVENLCITAGTPMPKIYIIQDPGMNAFATGRDPEHASIALTSGIIEGLENEELEGVIAHELSHIKNYDIRIMMIVVVLVGAISILSDYFLRSRWRKRDSNESNGNVGAILMVVGIILIVLSPIIAELIKLAISRKREFLADADGALLTRYPEGLARALEKITNNSTPLIKANTATAHLYIASPFGARATSGFKKLFSTHPPVEERIRQLRSMA